MEFKPIQPSSCNNVIKDSSHINIEENFLSGEVRNEIHDKLETLLKKGGPD